jgi:hypothetical protein
MLHPLKSALLERVGESLPGGLMRQGRPPQLGLLFFNFDASLKNLS